MLLLVSEPVCPFGSALVSGLRFWSRSSCAALVLRFFCARFYSYFSVYLFFEQNLSLGVLVYPQCYIVLLLASFLCATFVNNSHSFPYNHNKVIYGLTYRSLHLSPVSLWVLLYFPLLLLWRRE